MLTIAKKLLWGDEGRGQFATLLQHPGREICATAAVYLCSSMPEKALAVFRELAQGDDLLALGARMRIKEWEENPDKYDVSHWK